MSLRILRSGLLTTVQDLGRWGRQQFGVIVSGAMDPLALRLANLLVGNDQAEATLEITLLGPEIEFQTEALIALCGGDLSPTLGGERVSMWRPVWVRRGGVLSFAAATSGCRAYLAAAGGFDLPPVMGSRSTYLRAGLGGFQGRALQANDVLPLRSPPPRAASLIEALSRHADGKPFSAPAWSAGAALADYREPATIRVLRGGEFDWLTPESQAVLFGAEFRVTPRSDRMGYRLEGPKLALTQPRELISEAVCMGTIQLPPQGEPIILMADRATTGGYPKIACAATVDLSRLAQVRPGGTLRFEPIAVEEAQDLFRHREAAVERIQRGISFQFD